MSENPKRKDLIQAILSNDKLTEEEKSELIENFIEEIKKEYPELKYHATKEDLKNTELKLTKEIEEVRKEIKEVELKLSKEIEEVKLNLSKEIEEVRKEIKEVELKLSKEIKEVELKLTKEIEEVRKEIKDTKFSILKWQFAFWLAQMGVLLAIIFKILKGG
jgi:predicted  nucleic acid-binding Zn-ribbon protein